MSEFAKALRARFPDLEESLLDIPIFGHNAVVVQPGTVTVGDEVKVISRRWDLSFISYLEVCCRTHYGGPHGRRSRLAGSHFGSTGRVDRRSVTGTATKKGPRTARATRGPFAFLASSYLVSLLTKEGWDLKLLLVLRWFHTCRGLLKIPQRCTARSSREIVGGGEAGYREENL